MGYKMILSKAYKFSLIDIYMGVICIFPITTMLVDNNVWNKLLFGILAATHLLMLFTRPIKRKTLLLLLWLLVHCIYAIAKTSFPMANVNLLFYYPFFLVYTYFMTNDMDEIIGWFSKKRKFVRFLINLWTILVGISIFLPSSYYVREGGNYYFGSFCNTIFRLAPSAVFIQVLVLVEQVLFGKKYSVLYMIIPMYCFLMGSARTYMVVGFCIFVISWYVFCGKEKLFWSTIIPLAVAVFAFLGVAALGDKIAYTLDETQYGDFWFRITSSRNVLWTDVLEEWGKLGILAKTIGAEIEFSTKATGHWAHNDFIEILGSFGIIGLLQYWFSMRDLHKTCYGRLQIPKIIKLCAWMAWFFNAFFNMHYVYFCAMLCYPMLIFVIRVYFENGNKWKGGKRETTNGIYPNV